jgi:hypothetical protein
MTQSLLSSHPFPPSPKQTHPNHAVILNLASVYSHATCHATTMTDTIPLSFLLLQ